MGFDWVQIWFRGYQVAWKQHFLTMMDAVSFHIMFQHGMNKSYLPWKSILFLHNWYYIWCSHFTCWPCVMSYSFDSLNFFNLLLFFPIEIYLSWRLEFHHSLTWWRYMTVKMKSVSIEYYETELNTSKSFATGIQWIEADTG